MLYTCMAFELSLVLYFVVPVYNLLVLTPFLIFRSKLMCYCGVILSVDDIRTHNHSDTYNEMYR